MIKRITLLLFLSGCLFATEKTFVREYTYQASDYDSKVTSRANALEQVKRLLLEEVSMFIKSEINMSTTEETIGGESELKEFFENKITTITAGITETKILDEKWTGVEYWMKAEITIDPDDVDRKVSDIVNSREKLEELEEVKKKTDDALVEIERLKKELEKSKSDVEQLWLIKAYNKEIDALSATDWFNKGYIASMNEEYEKAISYYLRCIELDPNHAPYYNLGIIYGLQGNYTKAIESFGRGIELDPDDGDFYYNLGKTYRDQGNDTKAIELDPNDGDVYVFLGNIYRDQGKPGLMLSNYKKAARLGY